MKTGSAEIGSMMTQMVIKSLVKSPHSHVHVDIRFPLCRFLA